MEKAKELTQLQEFEERFSPIEGKNCLLILSDKRTSASFCECHIKGSLIVQFGTTDTPLDPENQPEYRANRDVELNHIAFTAMKADALKGRSFSNIVAEYDTSLDPEHPLKIVGGQHRFLAIQEAVAAGIDELHGVKVYFGLDMQQRIDVQAISNTNITVSKALLDRMRETERGPGLRSWCQAVGILAAGEDFSAKPGRGKIYVRLVRTFITDYMKGSQVVDFAKSVTTPVICPSGKEDEDWARLLETHPGIWKDEKLLRAGKEFALLVSAQRAAFKGKKSKPDYPDKALNIAITAGWAYVAGALCGNEVRLENHFGLRKHHKPDPLSAEKLSGGRFKSDPASYRGLGNRTDAKEAGRSAEVFWLQAEKGEGLTASMIKKGIYEI